MSLSLHTSFFWGRALYVAIAPYELGGRQKPLLPSSKTAASAMNGRYKARLWMIA